MEPLEVLQQSKRKFCFVCGIFISSSKKAWNQHKQTDRHLKRMRVQHAPDNITSPSTMISESTLEHTVSTDLPHIDAVNSESLVHTHTTAISTVQFAHQTSTLLSANEKLFVELKTKHTLSSTCMNDIISLMKQVDITTTPNRYELIEEKLVPDDMSIQFAVFAGIKVYYLIYTQWLYVILQSIEILDHLITKVTIVNNHMIQDFTTQRWFKEFIVRTPDGFTPIALAIYYDHWNIAQHKSIEGLYFSIINTPPKMYMKPDNKFVLALVPTGVDVQYILDLTLEGVKHPCKEVKIVETTFRLYTEIAEIVGDIPRLAELCFQKQHNANSPCRQCKIPKEQLFLFEQKWKKKTMQELKNILEEYLPIIYSEVHGQKGFAQNVLREHGLKESDRLSFWMELENFDSCRQSLTCLMHNEELGLFALEMSHFMQHIGDHNTEILFNRLIEMPKIPGIPAVKKHWIKNFGNLLAKEIIAICKRLFFCLKNLCDKCSSKQCTKSLKLHVLYLTILSQPSLHESLLDPLHDLIVKHHKNFVALYYKENMGQFLNIHLGLHWKKVIKEFEMPIFFSTMHYEPKHKKLKFIKTKQTNNHDHSHDILKQEQNKQICDKTVPNLKKSIDLDFCNSDDSILTSKYETVLYPKSYIITDDQTIALLKKISCLMDLDISTEIRTVKKIKWDGYKISPNSDVMVEGDNESLWFAKISKIFAHTVNRQILSIFCKVQWYLSPTEISQVSLKRYQSFKATLDHDIDMIEIKSVHQPVMTKQETQFNYYRIFPCYYVNAMYNLIYETKSHVQ